MTIDQIKMTSNSRIEGSVIINEITTEMPSPDPMDRARAEMVRFRIDTNEAAIREGLLRLGWFPPDGAVLEKDLAWNLCSHDKRHPLYADLHGADDPPHQIDPRQKCSCDNCFYGRTAMAASVIAMREALTAIANGATGFMDRDYALAQIALRALGQPHDHTVIP